MSERYRSVEVNINQPFNKVSKVLENIRHVRLVEKINDTNVLLLLDEDIRSSDFEQTIEQILKHLSFIDNYNPIIIRGYDYVQIDGDRIKLQNNLMEWFKKQKPKITDTSDMSVLKLISWCSEFDKFLNNLYMKK